MNTYIRIPAAIALTLALAGCAGQRPAIFDRLGKRAGPPAASAPQHTPSPAARPASASAAPEMTGEAPSPAAPQPTGAGLLGTTIASLGDPAEPGFWLRTPLVSAPTPGRVVYPASGRSVQVELRPSGGPAGGGSEASLSTFRLLDAPLTGLVELMVYRNPA